MNNITLKVTFDEFKNNVMKPPTCKPDEFRKNILKMQGIMCEMKENHVEPELEHFFAPGMYARQMTINKGVTIVGKIHKHSHINLISKGLIKVSTEFGEITYEAPITFVSNPGTKRCVHALEDTIWTTFHAVESTDLEEIEKHVIAEDYQNLLSEG